MTSEKRALVLVDLQHDFLRSELEPAAGEVISGAAQALAVARARRELVVHVRTTVERGDDRRMPHWRAANRWMCERGSDGHAFPPELEPLPGELVVDKVGFSGFVGTELDAHLRAHGITRVAIGGVHVHACVRTTALDAYQRGYVTTIIDGAVGSDDPVHAAITRRYLEARAITFAPFVASAPDLDRDLASATRALATATAAKPAWSARTPEARAELLDALAARLDAGRDALAEVIVDSIGKPITHARGEVTRAAALARAAAIQVRSTPLAAPAGPRSRVAWHSLGAVLALTPYNNPVAIPIGKLAPALGFGNVVVWKPAPLGHSVAVALHALIADLFGDALQLVAGGTLTARALMADAAIDAVTLSGSSASGHAAAEICARRRIPLQAELGGNNAAIVWGDTDLAAAARVIAEGAFGFAGQRCTANRRVIVDAAVHDAFVAAVVDATRALVIGDPRHPATQIGPLVTPAAANKVRALLARSSLQLIKPQPADHGPAWVAPTIALAPDPRHELVREETFGPVLVVQRARDWDDALALADGVRQGLALALFSPDAERRADFLARARAGILKLDQATADADAAAPFGGWKASGLGPPEHGIGNAAFYLRPQAIYVAQPR